VYCNTNDQAADLFTKGYLSGTDVAKRFETLDRRVRGDLKLFWVKSENSVDRCVVLENFGKLSSRFQASMSSYTDGDL